MRYIAPCGKRGTRPWIDERRSKRTWPVWEREVRVEEKKVDGVVLKIWGRAHCIVEEGPTGDGEFENERNREGTDLGYDRPSVLDLLVPPSLRSEDHGQSPIQASILPSSWYQSLYPGRRRERGRTRSQPALGSSTEYETR
jgi:hypothetical protein